MNSMRLFGCNYETLVTALNKTRFAFVFNPSWSKLTSREKKTLSIELITSKGKSSGRKT